MAGGVFQIQILGSDNDVTARESSCHRGSLKGTKGVGADVNRDQGKPTARKVVALHHAQFGKVGARVSPDRVRSIYETGSKLRRYAARHFRFWNFAVSRKAGKPDSVVKMPAHDWIYVGGSVSGFKKALSASRSSASMFMNFIPFPTWGSQVTTVAAIKTVAPMESCKSKLVPIGSGNKLSM